MATNETHWVPEEAKRTLLEAIDNAVPLSEVMMVYVSYILAKNGGNKVHAARALSVDRRSIQRWSKSRRALMGEPTSAAANSAGNAPPPPAALEH